MFKKATKVITRQLISEAEALLKEKEGLYKGLNPIEQVGDYFIQGLSPVLRAEPEHVGIYDKRYVKNLISKVFGGTGKSESGRTENQKQSHLLAQKQAEEAAFQADPALREINAKLEALRQETAEYRKQQQKYKGRIRRKLKQERQEKKDKKDERLFHSPIFQFSKLTAIRKVGKEMLEKIFKKLTGFHRTNDRVKRMGMRIELQETTYVVETVTDPETGKSVRASLDDVGPPNSQLTWEALANVLKLHVEYAIPMNRIAAMLGNEYFSTSNQSRWLSETAQDLLPVYVELFEQLANCPIFQGDDTTTKVLNIEPSTHEEALHQQVEKELPFEFDLKNQKGKKTQLNLTFVTGQVNADPRSAIRFYRTHLGSFGNLVTQLLYRRSRKEAFKDITIHGDLSTTNLPSSEYQTLFRIRVAGCGAHARRAFWEERKRIDACYFFLRCFQTLSLIEELYGKDRFKNPEALRKRQKYSRWVWEILRKGARTVMNQKRESPGILISYNLAYWPKESKFYQACQYLVNHYDELTFYLRCPELEWTNNLSERAQRKEKLMMHSSFFRQSRDGRAAMDILKTIMATAQTAKIKFDDYLQFVLLNQQDAKVNPHHYTPFAFALRSASNQTNEPSLPKTQAIA